MTVEAKKALRREMRRWRDAHARCVRPLAANVLLALSGMRRVAVFWPLPGEPDLRPAMREWHGAGYEIGLPRVVAPDAALAFARWSPGTAMRGGDHGTMHPDGPDMVPDAVVVPLLAFRRDGFRLGYGGGYYDRTLAGLPVALRVGCAFAGQEREDLPVEAHDVAMDMVATENEVILCDRGRPRGAAR